MKDTLILYRDWWEAIKSLPTDLQLDAFNAICKYAFEGEKPENPMICAVTALMFSAIDRDKAKWEDVREKRRQAGRRGAQSTNEKRWNSTPEQTSATSANADKCRQMPTNADTPKSEPEQPSTPQTTDTEEQSALKAEFEKFRSMYPGNKRGLDIEFNNLKKKYPKTWRTIIPLLVPAVERLIAYHTAANEAKAKGAQIFVPNFAYMSTWINNARWQDEFSPIPETSSSAPTAPSISEPDYSDTDFGGRKY